jgi:hypothetical protein
VTSPWVISLATGETEALDPAKVTPGMGGFLVFFLLALVSWALYRSLATHMRRVDVRARRDAEAQAGPPATVEPSGPQEQGARQDGGPVARTEPEDVPGEVR